MQDIIEIDSEENWKAAVEESGVQPVLIFKHSVTCPISAAAFHAYQSVDVKSKKFVVIVQKHRAISDKIEEEMCVQHESPQVLLIKNQQPIWHASHGNITKRTIQNALNE